jgi:hypothetical protein
MTLYEIFQLKNALPNNKKPQNVITLYQKMESNGK